MGEEIRIRRESHAVGILGGVRVAVRRWVVSVVEDAARAGRVGVDGRGAMRQTRLLGTYRVHPSEHRHSVGLRRLDELSQPSSLAGEVSSNRHCDNGIHEAFPRPRLDILPHLLVAFERSRHPDDHALSPSLACRGRVGRLSDLPHPFRQCFGVFCRLSSGDERGVCVEVQLDAVRRVVRQQFPDDGQSVFADFGNGVG